MANFMLKITSQLATFHICRFLCTGIINLNQSPWMFLVFKVTKVVMTNTKQGILCRARLMKKKTGAFSIRFFFFFLAFFSYNNKCMYITAILTSTTTIATYIFILDLEHFHLPAFYTRERNSTCRLPNDKESKSRDYYYSPAYMFIS